MNEVLPIMLIFLIVMLAVFWFAVFALFDRVLENPRLTKIQRIFVSILNTGITFALSGMVDSMFFFYLLLFAQLVLDFSLFYKEKFSKILFSASVCIIHLLVFGTSSTAICSIHAKCSMQEVLSGNCSRILLVNITLVMLNIFIFLVLKFVPTNKIRMINQNRDQQWFLLFWMSIFNLYLAYNAQVYSKPTYGQNLAVSQLVTSACILFGLYSLLLYMSRTASLLKYKKKNSELEQSIVEEQQYWDAVTKDAIIAYEFNISKDLVIKGFEPYRAEVGDMISCYSDMIAFLSRKMIYSKDIVNSMLYFSASNLSEAYGRGESESTFEYRRLISESKYIWVRAITNLVKDVGSDDIKGFTCVKDIDTEKRHQLELQFKAERDSLTGLYNRGITTKLIVEHLMSKVKYNSCAIFMIDVDNFKEINDDLGHIYGDAVLCELAENLSCIFGEEDVVGRIGGDEFMAYMKRNASMETVKEKAREILKAFRTVFKGQNDKNYTISGSVGISISPKDGSVFEELYNHADIALYEAKGKGKNTYCIYDGSSLKSYKANRTEIQDLGPISQKNFQQNKIEYIFKMLYQSVHSVAAIQSALELLANHYAFERGYIFEIDKDGDTMSNTFEWCICNVASEIKNLQYVPLKKMETAHSNFNKTGLFILRSLDEVPSKERELLEQQGIKTMFQFGIFDKDQLLGFVGFNNSKNESVLGADDIDELATICNIISTFLLKQRSSDDAINAQKKEQKEHIEQLEKLAYVDELTGGRNYYKFKEDAQSILNEQKELSHFIIKFDIDNFRLINQIYGYEKGDEILCYVENALRKTARNETEIFARIASDEFIVLYSIQDAADVKLLFESFRTNFNHLIGENFPFKCNFPYGRYIVHGGNDENVDIMDMFEKVNVAHKLAKSDKAEQFVEYDESMIKDALGQKEVENKMEAALKKEEFIVYLQPKYYLDNETIGGAEALVRWKNNNEDIFYPNAFIPIFERNGFVIKLDFYMLCKVCRIIKEWIEDGIEPTCVSVNFSRLHLSNRNFVKEIIATVDSFGIERKYIEIEITETVIYDNIDAFEGILVELHEAGFTMSMDDFGSGYSSLGILKNLAVDVIKMDRSFFVNQKDAERSIIIVKSVIEMASSLGIRIVAEGVEEREHIDLLKNLKCDMAQGYYFARPMPAAEFTQMLR